MLGCWILSENGSAGKVRFTDRTLPVATIINLNHAKIVADWSALI